MQNQSVGKMMTSDYPPVKRESLPRKAKNSAHGRAGVLQNRQAVVCKRRQRMVKPELSEEDIDNQKHSRAMDVLYQLQQRQEQVSASLDQFCSDVQQVQCIASELEAIEGALSRLTKILKMAKDELNNSQHFPRSSALSDSNKRKQLQMNTRLTKCASLSKTQKLLTARFAELRSQNILEMHCDGTDMSASTATSSSDNLIDDDSFATEKEEIDESICTFRDSSVFSTPPSTLMVLKEIPFKQPCYSQNPKKTPPSKSQAQDILDEILGDDTQSGSYTMVTKNPTVTSQRVLESANLRTGSGRHSIITSFNGKLFVSPPRWSVVKHLNRDISHHRTSYETVNQSSAEAVDMDTTGVFEPSQEEYLPHMSDLTDHELSLCLFSRNTANETSRERLDEHVNNGRPNNLDCIGKPLATSTQIPGFSTFAMNESQIASKCQHRGKQVTQEAAYPKGSTGADDATCASTDRLEHTQHGAQRALKKFVLEPGIKIAIIPDEALVTAEEYSLPDNLWKVPDSRLPRMFLDVINYWS